MTRDFTYMSQATRPRRPVWKSDSIAGTTQTALRTPESGKKIIVCGFFGSQNGAIIIECSLFFGTGNNADDDKSIRWFLPAEGGLAALNMVMWEKAGDTDEILYFKRITGGTSTVLINVAYLETSA